MPTSVKYTSPVREYYRVSSKGLTFDWTHVPPDPSPKPVFYVNVSEGLQARIDTVQVTKTWSRTPNYYTRKKNGDVLPDLPFNWRKIVIPVPSYAWTRSEPVHSGIYFQQQVGRTQYLGTVPAFAGADWNYVVGKLNSKLLSKAKQNQWNVPIFLAEAKKTSDMVVKRATDLVMIARAMRKGDLKGAFSRMKKALGLPGKGKLPFSEKGATKRYNKSAYRDASQAASNLWLETRYGWLPLMKDVEDAVSTLQDTLEDPKNKIARVKAKVAFPKVVERPYVHYPTDFYGMQLWWDLTIEREMTFRAIWRCSANDVDLPARFGLINPLEVAWELVPFSFVADWFLPIGDYLSHLDGSFRFNHLGGTYGGKSISKTTNRYSARYPLESFTHTPSTGEAHETGRTPMTSAPTLDISMMRFENPFSSGVRVTSSIALLRQQMNRFKR